MQLPRLSCKEGRGQGAGWYARQQPQRSKREGMRCNSPASPVRRGGGKGAGRYVRITAARESGLRLEEADGTAWRPHLHVLS